MTPLEFFVGIFSVVGFVGITAFVAYLLITWASDRNRMNRRAGEDYAHITIGFLVATALILHEVHKHRTKNKLK